MRLLPPPHTTLVWLGLPLLAFSCIDPIVIPVTTCTNIANITGGVRGIKFQIGTSVVCLQPSTVSINTFAIGQDQCVFDHNSTVLCADRHGGLVDVQDLNPSLARVGVDTLVQESDYWKGVRRSENYTADFDDAIQGKVSVAMSTIESFKVGVVSQGYNHNTGMFGLYPSSTVLKALVPKGASLSWAYSAGSQTATENRMGHLIIGGYDQLAIPDKSELKTFGIANDTAVRRSCPLAVNIDQLILWKTNNRSVDLLKDANIGRLPTCIEPYDRLFRFPSAVVDALTAAVPGFVSTDSYSTFLNVREPGLVYPLPFVNEIDRLEFVLSQGLKVSIPSDELQHNLQGYSSDGSWTTLSNVTELEIYGGDILDDSPVLGGAFLSMVYLIVENDKKTFSLGVRKVDTSEVKAVPFDPCDPPVITKANFIKCVVPLAVLVALFLLLTMAGCYLKRGKLQAAWKRFQKRNAERRENRANRRARNVPWTNRGGLFQASRVDGDGEQHPPQTTASQAFEMSTTNEPSMSYNRGSDIGRYVGREVPSD